MIKVFLLFSLLASCSSVPTWKSLSSRPDYKEKLIPVLSKDEARKVIGNKINFIKMIFQQSIDPYFGTPRWTNTCLALNIIGEVVESKSGIQSYSHLYLNPYGEVGFCEDRPYEKYSAVIYFYCEGMTNVTEVKYTLNPGEKLWDGNVCE